MSKADKTIAFWLCVIGLLLCAMIVIMRHAASTPLSAVGGGVSFVVVGAFTVTIGAILFGLSTGRL